MSKVALVTGGAVRVGRALTLGLVEAGFEVAVNYHRSEEAARELCARIEEDGGVAVPVPGDVADRRDVSRIAREVGQRWGRLHLLVNNASTFEAASLLDVDEASWDRVMAVNVKGPFLLVKETADLLVSAGGSVVNVVDLSAYRPWAGYPHHSVSKAALLHLTRVMALALAPRVRVNAVAPGTVLPPEDYTEEQRESSRRRTPLRTLGAPEDVVRAVLFLEASPFVTGEVLVVDGGRSITG